MKKKKIMSKMVRAGNKNHEYLDNLITLSKSNNDVYTGCTDYLFFKILNLEPIEYFNLTEVEYQEPITDEEIDFYQEDYINFETKNNFSDKIKNNLKTIENFARKVALKEKIIKEVIKGKYIEASNKYDSKFINTCIYKFYAQK